MQIPCCSVLFNALYANAGPRRIFHAMSMKAYRAEPVLPDDTMICYGVEARPQTETEPEYIVSEDPMDPVFYSTCYVRDKDIKWLPPPGGAPSPPKARWRFNGQCIDCKTYNQSKKGVNVSKVEFVAVRFKTSNLDYT